MDQDRGPRANQLAKGVARNQSVVLALPTSGCVNQGPAPETVRRSASLSEVSLAYRAGPGSPSGAASRCKPSSISSSPTRRRSWVVFYSLGDGADKGVYYAPNERDAVNAHSDSRLLLLLPTWPGRGHSGAMTLEQKTNARRHAAEYRASA